MIQNKNFYGSTYTVQTPNSFYRQTRFYNVALL